MCFPVPNSAHCSDHFRYHLFSFSFLLFASGMHILTLPDATGDIIMLALIANWALHHLDLQCSLAVTMMEMLCIDIHTHTHMHMHTYWITHTLLNNTLLERQTLSHCTAVRKQRCDNNNNMDYFMWVFPPALGVSIFSVQVSYCPRLSPCCAVPFLHSLEVLEKVIKVDVFQGRSLGWGVVSCGNSANREEWGQHSIFGWWSWTCSSSFHPVAETEVSTLLPICCYFEQTTPLFCVQLFKDFYRHVHVPLFRWQKLYVGDALQPVL